jgi:uncharacterized protein (TIGR00369 family)
MSATDDPVLASPLGGHLGMRLAEVGDGVAVIAIPFAPHLLNTNGLLHGGVLCAIADTAAGCAIVLAGGPDAPKKIATTSLTIDFIAAVKSEGEITATATVLRRGRSMIFTEVDLHDASGTLVAKSLVTYRSARTN